MFVIFSTRASQIRKLKTETTVKSDKKYFLKTWLNINIQLLPSWECANMTALIFFFVWTQEIQDFIVVEDTFPSPCRVVALQNVRKIYTLMCGQPSYSNRNLICYVTAPYSIPFRKWLLVIALTEGSRLKPGPARPSKTRPPQPNYRPGPAGLRSTT